MTHPTPSPDVSRMAYSITEARTALGIGQSTIYQLIAAGKLRTVKVGGRRLVPSEALAELLAGGAE